jgi:hypothetical protein
MKIMILSMALLGFASGYALLAEPKAEACTNPRWIWTGACGCGYSDHGYDVCATTGTEVCTVIGSGCGDGPGILTP